MLKPCLVIGTGFHRQVVQGNTQFEVLYSWESLLRKVAVEMGLPIHANLANTPTILWEQLLLDACCEGFIDHKKIWCGSRLPIYRIEWMARKVVAKIIADASINYPKFDNRAKYPLGDEWGAVCSFIFDTAWLSESTSKKVEIDDWAKKIGRTHGYRLTHCLAPTEQSKRIWFPNGSASNPTSIRLGYRDFGLQVAEIKTAFEKLKSFERVAIKKAPAKGGVNTNFDRIRPFLDGNETVKPNWLTWVAEFIYRPVFIAGLGMSESESGLWWLIAQRARNLALINPEKRPPLYILRGPGDDRIEFFLSRPFGITPIFCDNWSTGWQNFQDLAHATNENQ